ncbi:hypothetical protein F5Y10DRAFT_266306 [Nemania abortiva]|nr:hypothetical protein F5Y10DRAFT_266306 [Nemania abortiva]
MSGKQNMASKLKLQTSPSHSKDVNQPIKSRDPPSGNAVIKEVWGEDVISRDSTPTPTPIPVPVISLSPEAKAAEPVAAPAYDDYDDDDRESLYSTNGCVRVQSTVSEISTNDDSLLGPSAYAAIAGLNPYDFDVDNIADALADLEMSAETAASGNDDDRTPTATPTPARQRAQQRQVTVPNRADTASPTLRFLRRQFESFRRSPRPQSGDRISK